MRTNGNKILITGGNSGIGLELVRQFYNKDNAVIAVGRNERKLQSVKERFPDVDTVKCDFTQKGDLDNLILYLNRNHEDLNMVINNAGIQYNYHFAKERQLTYKIENEIRINLIAPIQLIASCLPLLERKENAAIINVSSGLGIVPKHSAAVYCGTKAGLHIFSKALRYQMKDLGIKVFEIIPPLVNTPMTEGRSGNKMSAEDLVAEFIVKFAKGKEEINIGKVGLLRSLYRIFPRAVERMMIKN